MANKRKLDDIEIAALPETPDLTEARIAEIRSLIVPDGRHSILALDPEEARAVTRAVKKSAREGLPEHGVDDLAQNTLSLAPGTGRIIVISLVNLTGRRTPGRPRRGQ